MGIETKSIEANFEARFSNIAKKSYNDLDEKKTPYIQAGHQAAIDTAIKNIEYPTAMTILTATEERASVVAKIRNLPDGKRESFKLPEAGSPNELESLKALSARLGHIARAEAIQSSQAKATAELQRNFGIGSPAQ